MLLRGIHNDAREITNNLILITVQTIRKRTLIEPHHDKTIKMTVRPAKTQISLGIRPVWSESSLCAQLVAKIQTFFMRTAKTLISLGGCQGWSESSLGAHAILLVLSWGGSIYLLPIWWRKCDVFVTNAKEGVHPFCTYSEFHYGFR